MVSRGAFLLLLTLPPFDAGVFVIAFRGRSLPALEPEAFGVLFGRTGLLDLDIDEELDGDFDLLVGGALPPFEVFPVVVRGAL